MMNVLVHNVLIHNVLIHKDLDEKIGKCLITRGNISSYRMLNKYMILFKSYSYLVQGLYSVFVEKFCNQYYIPNPALIFGKITFIKINSGSFFMEALRSFAMQKDVITFNGGQKGKTRQTLYMLGMIFGYRHVISKQEKCELTYRRGYLWAENKIDLNKEYTMKELSRSRVDWGNDYKGTPSWLPVGRYNDREEMLFKFNEDASCNKRGIMVRGPGVLHFYKANVISQDVSNKYYNDIMTYLFNKKR